MSTTGETSSAGLALDVDVCLPVYNGEEHVAGTIRSLLEQSHRSLRVLVFDNCSTDGTREVVRSLAETDERVTLTVSDRNRGAIWNFNAAIASAQAPFVMWASAHDLYDSRYVASCLSVLERQPNVVLCYSGARWIDENGTVGAPLVAVTDTRGLRPFARLNVVLWGFGDYSYAIYGLMRREALTQLHSWPKPYPNRVAPDHLMLGELSLVGEFAYVPEELFLLRRTADHGDFDAYAEKLQARPGSKVQAAAAVVKLIASMSSLTRGHDLPWVHRLTAAASGAAAGAMNYRGMARELWGLGRRTQRRRGLSAPRIDP